RVPDRCHLSAALAPYRGASGSGILARSNRRRKMSETVMMPTPHAPRPRGNGFVVPLLVIPFVLYNLVVFLFFVGNPINWGAGMLSIPMPSGMPWAITAGDLLLVVGIMLLFFEVLKSTNSARSSILEHMLSMLVFVLFL